MQTSPTVGRAEMEILQYVADHQPVSVGDVARDVAESKGLVRTTVLNVMERLRAKGYLVRRRSEGVYKYSLRVPKAELLRSLVRDFVHHMLGGSVSPFVAYLAEEADMSAEERQELRKVVSELGDKP